MHVCREFYREWHWTYRHTSTALPPLEPPDERVVSNGFNIGPDAGVKLLPQKQKSSHVDLPLIRPPTAINYCTWGSSICSTALSVDKGCSLCLERLALATVSRLFGTSRSRLSLEGITSRSRVPVSWICLVKFMPYISTAGIIIKKIIDLRTNYAVTHLPSYRVL